MLRRSFLATVPFALLAACGPAVFGGSGTPRPEMSRSYSLRSLQFGVLSDLVVSEDESYYPIADIVWRGDPRGARIPQIASMFQTAFDRNKPDMRGDTPIDLEITLVRFHAVTDLTRLTVGGVYNIIFDMTVRDARDGSIIEPTRRVEGNLDAPGGRRGQLLIEQGLTQRVRVTDFLTVFLRQQLV